jgi:hypothetical protein
MIFSATMLLGALGKPVKLYVTEEHENLTVSRGAACAVDA